MDPTQDQVSPNGGAVAPRGLVYAALVTALLPFALLVHRFDFLCDDAFITFRYSRNLADGLGLVYNPPHLEAPVEGYSEFLWAGLMGLGMKIGVGPEVLSRLLSVLAGALMVTGLVRGIARRYSDAPFAVHASALLLGSAPPLAVWSTGGMATMPTAALAVALFLTVHRAPSKDWRGRALVLGLIAAALTLMRADAALLVALVLSPPILVGLVRRNGHQWRPAMAAAGTGALVFFGHMAWRLVTYGDWVPNTARVKLGFSGAAAGRGFDYVVSAWLSMPGLGLMTLAALAGAWAGRRRVGAAEAIGVVALVVGGTAYAISSGGDFMCFARFLVPVIPFAVLGSAGALAWLEHRSRASAALVGVGGAALSVLAAFDVHAVPESTRLAFHFRHNQTLMGVKRSASEVEQWQNMAGRAGYWAEVGRALAQHAPPGSSLVYGAVGAIGYHSNLFIHDRNGLVTREVAMRPAHAQLRSPGHDKVVPADFFMRYNPTFVDAGLCAAKAFPPRAKAGARLEVLGEGERPGSVLWVERP
ncbi:MAG: hypothetical protein P8R46_15035 [Planctomycetota bacterium]|nr:hypothetical protein [Planctomycetota bacterium]